MREEEREGGEKERPLKSNNLLLRTFMYKCGGCNIQCLISMHFLLGSISRFGVLWGPHLQNMTLLYRFKSRKLCVCVGGVAWEGAP